MDTRIQTSFIPKAPIGTPVQSRKLSGFGVFFAVSIVVFLGTVGYTIFTYVRENSLTNEIEVEKEKIEDAKKKLDQKLVDEIVRTDKRIRVANQLLQNHTSLTPLLDTIKEYTLQSVRFSSFDYSKQGDKTQLRMKGEAASFQSVALQSDVLKDIKIFKDPLISDLVVGDDGVVGFNLSTSIKTSDLLYKPKTEVTQSEGANTPAN